MAENAELAALGVVNRTTMRNSATSRECGDVGT